MRSGQQAELSIEQRLAQTQQAEAVAAAVELVDVSLIFSFKQYLAEVLDGFGHLFMFPIAAIASIFRAIFRLREAYLEKPENKNHALLKAAVETGAALAITTAVVGSLVAAATFAVAAPIIFTATLAAKAAFHLAAGFYYGLKYWLAGPGKPRQAYLERMKNHFVLAAVAALTTVAAGLVLVAHKVSFGFLGMIGGGLGALYAIYRALTIKAENKMDPSQAVEILPSVPSAAPTSAASLQKKNKNPLTTASGISGVPTLSIVTELTPAGRPVVLTPSSGGAPQNRPLVSLEEKKMESEEAKDQKVFDALDVQLHALERNIMEKQAELNKKEGLHNNMGLRQKYSNSCNERMAPRPVALWDQLYEERNKKPEATQSCMEEMQTMLLNYNQLITDNKDLISRVVMKQNIAAHLKSRAEADAEEARNEALRKKCGMTKADILEFANLAGGLGNYRPG